MVGTWMIIIFMMIIFSVEQTETWIQDGSHADFVQPTEHDPQGHVMNQINITKTGKDHGVQEDGCNRISLIISVFRMLRGIGLTLALATGFLRWTGSSQSADGYRSVKFDADTGCVFTLLSRTNLDRIALATDLSLGTTRFYQKSIFHDK